MSSLKVELRYAPLPLIGMFAWHYWLVVDDGAGCQRWEVWQTKNAGGSCIGHVHCNLKAPAEGVGGGPSRVSRVWKDDAARRIAEVLRDAASYPYCERYRMWPGPNSNTFVAWVLRQAGIDEVLDPRGLGRNYRRDYRTAKQ
jgi:hypothetical protein